MTNERPFTGEDLTGQKYGRLTVVSFIRFHRFKGLPNQRHVIWKCRCDCGNEVELSSVAFKYGNTSSCGCLHKELLATRMRKHGFKPGNGKPHPLYYRWYGMIQRCNQPKHHGYKWYLGKGIKVCKRWRNFALFLKDMESTFKPGLTLHRKNNDKGYTPSNVVWATWKEQNAP